MRGIALARYTINHEFMSVIGPSQAWFAGLIAADGYVRSSLDVTIGQSGPDGLELMQHVAHLIGFTGLIRPTETSRQPSWRIWFRSRQIGEVLGVLGLNSPKSTTLTFPTVLDQSVRRDFLRGYVEGDGSIGIYNAGKCMTLTLSVVGTEAFITDARAECPLQGHVRRLTRATNCYELRWHGSDAERVSSWLWGADGLYVGRKAMIARRFAEQFDPRYRGREERVQKAGEMLRDGRSVVETAAETGVAFQTLYRWRSKGLLSW